MRVPEVGDVWRVLGEERTVAEVHDDPCSPMRGMARFVGHPDQWWTVAALNACMGVEFISPGTLIVLPPRRRGAK